MLVTTHVRAAARSRRLGAALLATTTALTVAGSLAPTSVEASTVGYGAVQEASRHNGQPYVWGAAGPTRFDCSGLTKYVYGRLGRSLPHSAAGQYTAAGVVHISQASRAVGDLIFMRSSSGAIYHVGIYAGSNRWWIAPKTGDHVRLQTLYSSHYSVGRVR